MPFHLRPHQPGDFETLYALDHQCYVRGIAYSRATLRWFLSLRGGETLVAEDEPAATGAPSPASLRAGIIGFIVGEIGGEMDGEMGERDRKSGHIITLDVSPDRRREGIGTALLGELERRLAARGAARMELETATDNQVAIAFWQRHGYRAVGVIEHYYLKRIDALEMSKSLAEQT